VGGDLRASFVLTVTVAADAWDWVDQAAAVERVAVLSAPWTE
jgi:hypothetical protein